MSQLELKMLRSQKLKEANKQQQAERKPRYVSSEEAVTITGYGGSDTSMERSHHSASDDK
jgi:hypothetical protein